MTSQAANDQSMQPSERSIFLPRGRIGRVAYGVRFAATFAGYAVVGSFQEPTAGGNPNALMTCLSYILFAFLVVTSIKRLHDIGYGAAAVIFLGPIIPLLLFAPGERGPNAYGNQPEKPSGGAAMFFPLAAFLLFAASVNAQLAVTVSSPKVAGQKAVVPLVLKNDFTEAITSARAAVFVSDERGKVAGQATRWVIGGQAGPAPEAGLRPGATNSFHFVVTSAKPFTTTNLTAKVIFNRVILEGGRSVDPRKSVTIREP